MDTAAYDTIAMAYHRMVDPDGHGLRDPAFETLLGDIRGQRVLALGCGQGRDARLLAALGADVTGIDVSTRLLAYARELEGARPRGIRYVEGSAHDLAGFDDTCFDGVACYMALIDIPELSATFASVSRVLKPTGWFAFSIVHPCYQPHVENAGGYAVEGRYDRTRTVDWLPPHGYRRRLATYVNLLAEHGLPIERMVESPGPHGPAPEDGDNVPHLLYVRCRRMSGTA
jgi:ubiquinone/menaquinone biosynthesis C-methylase UbiE